MASVVPVAFLGRPQGLDTMEEILLQAKEMIRGGLVQLNHITLDSPDKLCDNNGTISIRGKGRFRFLGVIRKTGGDRVAIEIEQSI